MRKEIIVAIFAGLIIGLAVAFGAWRFNSQVADTEVTPEVITTEGGKAELASNSLLSKEPITLTSIEDFDVITVSPFRISGITKADSNIIISAENKDYFAKTESDGSFEVETDLASGVNQLLIAVYGPEDVGQSKNLSLIYSKEFAELMENVSSENTSTESANTVLDKVRQKVESLRKNPKAILGTVADKTEDTLQINNLNEKIELVSIAEDTTFVKTNGNTSDIKFSDVGIGDFVISLGFGNGGSVLDAKRIIMTDKPGEPDRSINFGEITNLSRKDITIADSTGKNSTFTLPKRWTGPDVKDLETGITVLIVSEKGTLRTIEVLKKSSDSAEE